MINNDQTLNLVSTSKTLPCLENKAIEASNVYEFPPPLIVDMFHCLLSHCLLHDVKIKKPDHLFI